VNKVPLKIIESKKGISPILVTLLLIVIAVAAIVATCDWIMTRTGITAAEAGKQIHTANDGFAGSPNVRIDIGSFVTLNPNSFRCMPG
jgi:flagellin-like protein